MRKNEKIKKKEKKENQIKSNKKEEIIKENIQNLNDKFIISNDITEAENYDADTVLTPELLEIYSKIKQENRDFKINIFNKNIDNLYDNVGNFDTIKLSHTFNMKDFDPLMKNILSPNDLFNKYVKKSSEI
jgi:hypothetical protein